MKTLIRTALLCLLLSAASFAHAGSVVERAQAYALALRDQAAGSVVVAEGRVAEAESNLRVMDGVLQSSMQSGDNAAIVVAQEAMTEARLGVRDAYALLQRARELLGKRELAVNAIAVLVKGDSKAAALVVPVDGTFRIHEFGGDRVASDSSAVAAGVRIDTAGGGKVRLFAANGAEVELSGNTSFQIETNDEISGFEGVLNRGFAQIRALVREKLGRKFEVRTTGGTCSVRGTQFEIAADEAGSVVRVREGLVRVTAEAGGAVYELSAGSQLRYVVGRGYLPQEAWVQSDAVVWK